MLKNTIINRKATLKIANALGDLNQEVVYVGGAMVSLYIDDQAAEDIRPTKDIDLTFEIHSHKELEGLRQQLIERGFIQSAEDTVICRFRYDELKVDVMSTQQVGWAPSNRWFAPGFAQAIDYELDGNRIRIMPLPYFLATKIEAFFDRGINDVYASHDLEDIVYLLNYTSSIAAQILNADSNIKQFLADSFLRMRNNERIMIAMTGHLYYEESEARMEVIRERMNTVIDGL